MKRILLLAVMIVLLSSCSNEYKAEHAVTEFVKKFSTNKDSYDPVEFSELNKTDKGYTISHGYRIVDKSGTKHVIYHVFKLDKSFNVYVDPFEEFD